MPGITKSEGRSPNSFVWAIHEKDSARFEDIVFEHLRLTIGTVDGLISCRQTRRVRDQGMDVEIRSRKPLHVLGHNIELPVGKDEIFIRIEVKCTSADRLSAGYLEDYAQAIGERCDVYLLATNATITPYYQYLAQRNWASTGSIFLLVDRWLLGSSLVFGPAANQFAAHGIDLPTPEIFLREHDEVVIEYQYEWSTRISDDDEHVDIYLSIRRFGGAPQEIAVALVMASGQDWQSVGDDVPSRALMPNGFLASRLRCRPVQAAEGPPLRLRIECGVWRHLITAVSKPPAWAVFEPPMIGCQHAMLRENLHEWLAKKIGPNIVSITGEAGIGKSRVIQEALKAFVDSQYRLARFIFNRAGTSNNWTNLLNDIVYPDREMPPDLAGRIATLLKDASRIPHTVLLFEDLHHAPSEVIQVFRQAVAEGWLSESSLRIVLTGRNDSTFPNDEYFALLALIETEAESRVIGWALKKLERYEIVQLAQAILPDAPPSAIERITNLGDGNPFILLQTIQHLLDRDIAIIATRQTISILRPELLHRPDSLPSSVLKLYEARLSALGCVENGCLARQLLGALSFFGFELSEEIYLPLLDGNDGDAIWNLLERRGFVARDFHGRRSFAHENLLNHFREWVRNSTYKGDVVSLIMGEPIVFDRLPRHAQGEVLWLAGRVDEAWERFSDIWNRVVNITNVSSEQIDKAYFPYLDAVIDLAHSRKESAEKRAKACCALAYMGIHNFPVMIGIECCNRVLKYLDASGLKKTPEAAIGRLRVRQLRAHGRQNLGKTSLALQEMLEVAAEVEQAGIDDAPLLFDLYDRLQEYYRKVNHRRLSDFYGSRAKAVLQGSDDERLRTCSVITDSIVRLYDGQEAALAAAIHSKEHSAITGIHRLQVYTRLTVLVARALYAETTKEFCDIRKEATELLEEALVHGLSDSIMRCELLLGTLAFHIGLEMEEARGVAALWANHGLDHSSRFGNGLFDWAFYNLLGVVNTRGNRFREEARRPFETCLDVLHWRGLTFLGAFDGCHPTIYALSNIVRFFSADDPKGEMPRGILRRLSAYNTDRLAVTEFSSLIENATAGQPLFPPNRPSIALRLRVPADNIGHGYFTPLI